MPIHAFMGCWWLNESQNSHFQTYCSCLQLLSLKKGDTLALKMTIYGDPISHIIFCVNLVYADDNISVSDTRMGSLDQDTENIRSDVHGINETNEEWFWKKVHVV